MNDEGMLHVDITCEGWKAIHIRIPWITDIDPTELGELIGMSLEDLWAAQGRLRETDPLPEAVA